MSTPSQNDFDRHLDQLLGGRTPAEMRALIEADIAEAKRLRALGSHDDIIVEPNGDVFRLVNGWRQVVAFGEPDPNAPVSWFDPMTLLEPKQLTANDIETIRRLAAGEPGPGV